MRLPPLAAKADGSSNAEQQGGHPHAQLDSLLAEGKLLDAALLAAKQQQQLQAGSACGKTLAARAQVVVAVEADSATTHAASDAAADGHTLQEQQQEEKQQDMWQRKCSKLQAWAAKVLQHALPDLSLAELHKQLLRQAANSSSSSSDKPLLDWWRLPQLHSDAEYHSQLATAVLYLSSSREQGWARLEQALSHGLAAAAAPAALPGSGSENFRQRRRTSRMQAQHHWLPHSAPKRLSELQSQQAARVKDVLASLPCSATLCVDLSEAGQLLLPRTYLQLVLLSLAEPPPEWVLRALFTDPFAEALQLALGELLSNPDGDASPFIPMLQQQTPQLGDFRRVYPSCDAAAAAAGTAGSGGSISGLAGRQQSSLLGDEQARGFLWRAGNRALLGVLASIFRDVQEFEAGLLLAAAECTGPCKCRLAALLTRDLQRVLQGCRQQLHELLTSTAEQLFVNVLEEELLQQPLNDLLSATGSRGEAAGLGALSLRANSITGRGANSLASSGVAGAGAAADEVLSQPQQVSQGQQQVLLFAGLFLARRQQFPLLVQDVLSWLCVLRRVLPARMAADILVQMLLHTTQHLSKLTVACAFAKAGTASGVLLDSINAEPAYAKQLQDMPGFGNLLDCHMRLHDLVNEQAPLELAKTKVSDEQGVFLRHTTAEPFKSAAIRVQTLSGPSPIDWAHHTFAVAPSYCYSKSSVFAARSSLLPHLELEMGTSGDGSSLLLYINMDPRLSLVCHPHYLDRFYCSAPPGAGSSWMQLEQRAQQQQGFTRFTSPSLHVRACSATAILFNVKADDEGMAAVKGVITDAVQIWLAWLKAGGASSATDAAAVQAAVGKAAGLDQQQELSQRDAAWRGFPRREAAAAVLRSAFGEAAMEDYWDSMAGAARIRL
ncbi:hypothetical protein OEZ85_000553 [Tetradesmus obliquus]|uniref:FPL domain-containing protein n=1 Tax=Tetradesmus obliquus TaxID=3088 RepID=A0ABY8UIK8_TETOB|nr:hypothetical protein OEZ85_000553 [Tetradesmus obliquus]